MLTRRGFGACAICAAVGGLAAVPAAAQQVGETVTGGGVARTILRRTDHDARYVTLLVKAEVAANVDVPRHTHPGIESSYVTEGGLAELTIQGQPGASPKAGDTWQVAANTPHGGKNGPQRTTIISTYVVEKDKPLTSPA